MIVDTMIVIHSSCSSSTSGRDLRRSGMHVPIELLHEELVRRFWVIQVYCTSSHQRSLKNINGEDVQ